MNADNLRKDSVGGKILIRCAQVHIETGALVNRDEIRKEVQNGPQTTDMTGTTRRTHLDIVDRDLVEERRIDVLPPLLNQQRKHE